MITSFVALSLAACSGGQQAAGNAQASTEKDAAKPAVSFKSPVDFSADPKVKQQQQSSLVDLMVKDVHVDLETLKGEAMRRGVTLSPEQIAAKQAQVIDKRAPSAPVASPSGPSAGGPDPTASPAE